VPLRLDKLEHRELEQLAAGGGVPELAEDVAVAVVQPLGLVAVWLHVGDGTVLYGRESVAYLECVDVDVRGRLDTERHVEPEPTAMRRSAIAFA